MRQSLFMRDKISGKLHALKGNNQSLSVQVFFIAGIFCYVSGPLKFTNGILYTYLRQVLLLLFSYFFLFDVQEIKVKYTGEVRDI